MGRVVLAATALVASLAFLGCSSEPEPSIPSSAPSAAVSASAPPNILPIDADQLANLRGPWSPTPFPLPSAALEIVDSVCRRTYPEDLAALALVIVDARGEEIVNAWYVGTTGGNYGCEGLRIDPLGTLLPGGFGSGTGASELIPVVAPQEVIAWYTTHQEAPIASLAAAGPIGSSIAEVRFTAEGKPPIVATIMNGWFAVWLPDDWPRLTLRGYNADGTEVFANLDW